MDPTLSALVLAIENQMTPLILNALAGLACVLVREGETERSLELYQLMHEHPQTPTIYLDLAERWFPDLELPSFRDKSKESEEKDDGRGLDKIVVSILKA
jgi:pentatricopeptide repeat protein